MQRHILSALPNIAAAGSMRQSAPSARTFGGIKRGSSLLAAELIPTATNIGPSYFNESLIVEQSLDRVYQIPRKPVINWLQ